MRRLLAAAALAALAGCGGSPSLEQAKRDFKAACVNGESGQQRLCDCVVGELSKKWKTGARFADADRALRDGRRPRAVVDALTACARQTS